MKKNPGWGIKLKTVKKAAVNLYVRICTYDM